MEIKKILGLDIGTTSIGWAIVEAKAEKPQKAVYKNIETKETETDINNDRIGIHIKDGKAAVGVRIIKQDTHSIQQFNLGKKLNDGTKATPTAKRRQKRGSRRLKSRYKLRRQKLHQVLDLLGMLPEGITKNIDKDGMATFTQDKNSKYYTAQKGRNQEYEDIGETIYKLRDCAIRDSISLSELGRILLHLNQWRGYSSDRFAIKEKQFNYNICKIEKIDWENKISILDNKKNNELKYYEVRVDIVFDEDIKIITEEEVNGETIEKEEIIKELKDAIIYLRKELLINDTITVKVPKVKIEKDKKGKVTKKIYKLEKTEPDETDTNYQRIVFNNSLSDYCKDNGTVGSYFYQNFYVNKTRDLNRIRTNIVNRDWYEKELDKIFKVQYEKHKTHFESFKIEQIVAAAFRPLYKDGNANPAYQQILNELKNLTIEFEENGKKKKRDSTKAEKLKYLIKDLIIYYQRPWQQAKNKGECKFEFIDDVKPNPEYKESISDKKDKWIPNPQAIKIITDNQEKKHYLKGRTVIPRSHPLHQEFKIWNQINNVKLVFISGDEQKDLLKYDSKECKEITGYTSEEIKDKLFVALSRKSELTWRTFAEDLLENTNMPVLVLGIGKGKKIEEGKLPDSYFTVNYTKRNRRTGEIQDDKLKGNKTLYQIDKVLQKEKKEWYNEKHKVSKDQPVSNLQLLWETIYDISIVKKEKVAELLKKHFPDFTPEQCHQLSNIKFDDAGMASLSAKAIRNLLPLMSNGVGYTPKAEKKIASLIKVNEDEKEFENENKLLGVKDFFKDAKTRLELATKITKDSYKYLSFTEASAVIYGSHSSKGIAGNFKPIETVRQHSMNNPIVEKIVNETIKVVNDIYTTYAERDSNGNVLLDENGKPKMGFDEVRIELSRELKASADEREAMDEGMRNNSKRNELAKRMIRELFNGFEANSKNITLLKVYQDEARNLSLDDYNDLINKKGVKFENDENKVFKKYEDVSKEYKLTDPSKADIVKYKLWLEQKCQCPYTGEVIMLSDIFTAKYEKEHILPRALYPLDEYSNYVITRKLINAKKGDRIARHFIEQEQERIYKDEIDGKELKILSLAEYENHVKRLFPKGKKLNNLLRKDIPEEPINRQLKDTQYINKKLKEKLAEIVGSNKVHTTTGQVTDILREGWHLIEIFKQLLNDRYNNFKPPLGKGSKFEDIREIDLVYDAKNAKGEDIRVHPNFSKRLDHRHHALDAIIIASTKQNHIQYLNTLNASSILKNNLNNLEDVEKNKAIQYKTLKDEIKYYDETKKKSYYKLPWNEKMFFEQVKNSLDNLLVVQKNSTLIVSPSKNKLKNGKTINSLSIRNNLQKENFIGTRTIYNDSKTSIYDIIELIFNDDEFLANKATYELSIKRVVFKKKYQDKLIALFKKHININDFILLKSAIINEVEENKATYFEHASTFKTTTIKKVEIKFVSKKVNEEVEEETEQQEEKEVPFITSSNDRVKRYFNIRNNYYQLICNQISKSKDEDEKKQLTELKKDIENITKYPLFHNAIYDIRTKGGIWKLIYECKGISKEEIEYLKYNKSNKTYHIDNKKVDEVFSLLTNYEFDFNNKNLLLYNPIKTGKDIHIKSTTINNRLEVDTLYTIPKKGIRPKTLVQLDEKYQVLILEDELKNIKFEFIEYMLAIQYKQNYKLNPENYLYNTFPIPLSLINNNQLLFTLAKGDYVFYDKTISNITQINWDNWKYVKDRLYRVTLFETKSNYINIEKVNTAKGIQLIDKFHIEGITKQITKLRGKITELKNGNDILKFNVEDIDLLIASTTKDIDNLKNQLKDSNIKNDKIRFIELKQQRLNLENLLKETNQSRKEFNNKIKQNESEIKELDKETSKINATLKLNRDNLKSPIEETTQLKLSPSDIFIKVFTNRLGTKIVQYTKFSNGIWNKEEAKDLGLIL